MNYTYPRIFFEEIENFYSNFFCSSCFSLFLSNMNIIISFSFIFEDIVLFEFSQLSLQKSFLLIFNVLTLKNTFFVLLYHIWWFFIIICSDKLGNDTCGISSSSGRKESVRDSGGALSGACMLFCSIQKTFCSKFET